MAEISSPDYPGERLIACYNPLLAAERARMSDELLDATEAELDKIDQATRRARRPLRGKNEIALAVGKVINKKKGAKHFTVDINDEGLSWQRDEHVSGFGPLGRSTNATADGHVKVCAPRRKWAKLLCARTTR